ncbi:hypothetical protein [Adlercreutzia sp. ZJ242]|uniref:hypothetical protein n=1 Tax=Adlercreutzia sp. ZJ242 TaxID=2709409 RepID=UPI00197DE39E|nr:hypothetical protein [Adlercreutzia sp. ZJ242]
MTQRNPMNERYTSDERPGKTRKSAASAKPKTQAAASVIVKTTEKTPQQKKAERKAERKKAQAEQRALDRKYYKPDTKRYKTLRLWWWVTLIGAIACTAVSFLGRELMPDAVALGVLFAAYALIIIAFYIDMSPIRKERRAYQERMIIEEEKQKKAERAAARAERAQQAHKKGSGKNQNRHAKPVSRKPAEEASEAPVKEEPVKKPRKSLFGSGFRLSNREKINEEKARAKAADADGAADKGAEGAESTEGK